MTDTVPTQDQPTGAGDGRGAPKDAPSVRTFTESEFDTHNAKVRRAAEAEATIKAQAELLMRLGVADDSEALELIEHGRKARPKKQDDPERLAEKIRAQADAEKAKLAAEIEALRAEKEAALVRDAAKSVLLNAGLVEGGADLVLASLGLGPDPEHRLVFKDGKVAVVDRDGDPAGKPVDKFLLELVPDYLRAPSGAGRGGPRTPSEPKPVVSGPPRKLTTQEQIDAAVQAGLASVSGNR